jgi:hypothetical protein
MMAGMQTPFRLEQKGSFCKEEDNISVDFLYPDFTFKNP